VPGVTEPGRDPATPSPRSRRDQARLAVGALAIVAATALTLSNTQKVRIDWVVTTTETPLIVALLVSTLLGALLGIAAVRQRRHRKGGGGAAD
jgi:uncharacterized integral membrane protein